jgi:peptidoglycan/LPS O-acetylase OafA/YrhL
VAPLPKPVSDQLDSIRGLSAIVVVIAHVLMLTLPPDFPLVPVLRVSAQLAVLVFFAISGLLVTRSIVRNHDAGRFRWGAYACDRANRIVPPLLVAVALTVVLSGFSLSPGEVAGMLLFVNGFAVDTPYINGPLWSLAIEVWLYALAGMVATRRPLVIAAAVLLFAALAFHSRLFVLLAAVWFAGSALTLGVRLWVALVPMVLLLAGMILRDGSVTAFAARATPYTSMVAGMAIVAGLYAVVTQRVRLPAPFKSSAAYSYTLYITHFPLALTASTMLDGYPPGIRVLGGVGIILICWECARVLARVEQWKPLRAAGGPHPQA